MSDRENSEISNIESGPDEWADDLAAGKLTRENLAGLARQFAAGRDHSEADGAKIIARLARNAELDHRAGQVQSAEARATVTLAVAEAMVPTARQSSGGGFLSKLLSFSQKSAELIDKSASQAHITLGGIARDRGDLAGADKEFRAALASARSLKDADLAQGVALMELGHNLQLQGRNAEAEESLRQAHPLLVRSQGGAYVPLDTYLLGIVQASQERWDDALRTLEQTEAEYGRHDVVNGVLDSRLARVDVLIRTGRIDEAERLAGEASRMATELDLPVYIGQARWHLSRIKRARGKPDEAIALLDEAASNYERAGDSWHQAQSLMVRAEIQMGEGRVADSDKSLDAASRMAREMHSPFLEADCVYARGLLRASAGQGSEARRLLETARKMYAEQGRDGQAGKASAELEKL